MRDGKVLMIGESNEQRPTRNAQRPTLNLPWQDFDYIDSLFGRTTLDTPRRGSQVVRSRSAKPLFAGSIPAPASHHGKSAANGVGYAKFFNQSCDAVIRVYDEA